MRLKKEAESTGLIVKDVLRDGPAESQGIRAGDELLQINDVHVQGLGPEDVMLLIRGPPGSSVSLSILRESKLLHVSVPRDVEILSVGAISPAASPLSSDRDESDKEHIRRLLSSRMPRPITNLRGSLASDYGRPLCLDSDNSGQAGAGAGAVGCGSRPSSTIASQRSSRGPASCTDPLGQCQPAPPATVSARRPQAKRESSATNRRSSAAGAAGGGGGGFGRSSLASVRTDASSPQTFIFETDPARRRSATPSESGQDCGRGWPGADERAARKGSPVEAPGAPGAGAEPWRDGCGDVGCHRLCPAAVFDDGRRLCPLPSLMMGWPAGPAASGCGCGGGGGGGGAAADSSPHM